MNNQNKNEVAKPFVEVLKEAVENTQKHEVMTSEKSAIEKFMILGEEFQKAHKANEARKTPAQLALERELSNKRYIEREKEHNLKQKESAITLFKTWIKRDTWLVFDEAIHLRAGKKPEDATIFDEDTELHALIKSCAGHSLKIINLNEKPSLWRVDRFEWVRWLKDKNEEIHPELEALLFPVKLAKPTIKTAKAIQSREIIKRDRQKALKAFAELTSSLARKQNIVWDSKSIPVTKAEFLEVFSRLNPAIKKITSDTFDHDIAAIGLSFKRGTKSNKNNALKTIHSLI